MRVYTIYGAICKVNQDPLNKQDDSGFSMQWCQYVHDLIYWIYPGIFLSVLAWDVFALMRFFQTDIDEHVFFNSLVCKFGKKTAQDWVELPLKVLSLSPSLRTEPSLCLSQTSSNIYISTIWCAHFTSTGHSISKQKHKKGTKWNRCCCFLCCWRRLLSPLGNSKRPKWRRQPRQLGFSCERERLPQCSEASTSSSVPGRVLGMNPTLLGFAIINLLVSNNFKVPSGQTLAKWRRPGFFFLLLLSLSRLLAVMNKVTQLSILETAWWREALLWQTRIFKPIMVQPAWRKYTSRLRKSTSSVRGVFPILIRSKNPFPSLTACHRWDAIK